MLFKFLDWMMVLPEELEEALSLDLAEFERERMMPYVSSIERIAREKGKAEGKIEESGGEGRDTAAITDQTIQGGPARGIGGPHSIHGRPGHARRLDRHQPGGQRLGGFPANVRDLSMGCRLSVMNYGTLNSFGAKLILLLTLGAVTRRAVPVGEGTGTSRPVRAAFRMKSRASTSTRAWAPSPGGRRWPGGPDEGPAPSRRLGRCPPLNARQ